MPHELGDKTLCKGNWSYPWSFKGKGKLFLSSATITQKWTETPFQKLILKWQAIIEPWLLRIIRLGYQQLIFSHPILKMWQAMTQPTPAPFRPSKTYASFSQWYFRDCCSHTGLIHQQDITRHKSLQTSCPRSIQRDLAFTLDLRGFFYKKWCTFAPYW